MLGPAARATASAVVRWRSVPVLAFYVALFALPALLIVVAVALAFATRQRRGDS